MFKWTNELVVIIKKPKNGKNENGFSTKFLFESVAYYLH